MTSRRLRLRAGSRTLIGVAASIALIAAGIALWLRVSGPRGRGFGNFRLPNADWVVSARLSEIVAAKEVGRCLSAIPLVPMEHRFGLPLELWLRNVGVHINEVERFDLSAARSGENRHILAVARMCMPVEPAEVLELASRGLVGSKRRRIKVVDEHRGIRLYRHHGHHRGWTLALIGTHMIVWGDEASLRQGIENYMSERLVRYPRPISEMFDMVSPGSILAGAIAFSVLEDDTVRLPYPFNRAQELGIEGVTFCLQAVKDLNVSCHIKSTSKTDEVRARVLRALERTMARLSWPDERCRAATRMLKTMEVGSIKDYVVLRARVVPAEAEPWVAGILTSELLARPISSNETAATSALFRYLAAQHKFRKKAHYGEGRRVYANPVDGAGFTDLWQLSTPGGEVQRIGLISPAMARATSPETPYAGYYFVDIVSCAGKEPLDYSKDHGLCAVPAEYGATGRNTFIINSHGTIYLKDNRGKPNRRWPDWRTDGQGWIPGPCSEGMRR